MGALAKLVCLLGAGGAAVGTVYMLTSSGRRSSSSEPLELGAVAGEPKPAPAELDSWQQSLAHDGFVIVHARCLDRLLGGKPR